MLASEPFVVTIVAPPGTRALTAARLAEARALLPGASAPVWLADHEAADLVVPAGRVPRQALEAWGQALRLDVFVQPAVGRRKRLLLADMDSTLIGQECIDELADFVGLKPQVAAITERAMRGEIAFEPALRARVALLAGLPAAAVETVLAERITLTPGARTLVATMRAHGAFCALVSGGFTVFTAPLARTLGMDEDRGNVLLVEAGVFTGAVAEPILGRAAKYDALQELAGRLGLRTSETMAVGDGANDLAMLEAAGLGVAFRAKPAVAAAAAARVDFGDLTALLYAQGYPATDIVA